jgi:hypothetical protein
MGDKGKMSKKGLNIHVKSRKKPTAKEIERHRNYMKKLATARPVMSHTTPLPVAEVDAGGVPTKKEGEP